MAVKDDVLIFVRNTLAAVNVDSKIIVAPTKVGVYLNRSKDILERKVLGQNWKFQNRGLFALVYHPVLNRLKLLLVDEKTAQILWEETFGDYTNYETVHDVFHVLNSSKNFCQKIGLFYADEKVAKMVSETLEIFTAQKRREIARRARNGKIVTRSKSLNSAERVKVEVKLTRSYSNSMGDIKIHRTALNLFENEAKKYCGKQSSRRPSLRKMFSGIKSSFRVRIRRQDNEIESFGTKRSRLSHGMCESSTELNQDGTAKVTHDLEYLSANWKLSDLEIQELYRLSFFNESDGQSTDLCATEL